MKEKHASDSSEQRFSETLVISELKNMLQIELCNTKLIINGASVQIDGYNLDEKVIIEVYSGVGSLKPGQIKKVMTDVCKLLFVEKELFKGEQCKKILCFIDEDVCKHFNSGNWQSKALNSFGIEVKVVKLPEEEMDKICNAKKRQKR